MRHPYFFQILICLCLIYPALTHAEAILDDKYIIEDEPAPAPKPTGRLHVKVEPADARVMILKIKPKYHDGIELDEGTYTIKAIKDGYDPKTMNVKVEPGRDNVYDMVLSKAAAPPPTAPAAARPASGGGKPGQIWTEPTTGMEFVWIPGGCFQMGSPSGEAWRHDDEGPVHEVCVDGFWMGKYEVTNGQYRKYKPGHSSKDFQGRSLNSDRQPAVYMSWNDAKGFAAWLSGKGNGKFRLPTEAEWEYAARAGTRTARYWGDSPDQACAFANVADQSAKRQWPKWPVHNCDDGHAVAAPVGSFRPNNFGLFDMLGNVWEWCEDVYDKNGYSSHSRQNPLSSSGGSDRVDRGGSWYNSPRCVRSADRFRFVPDYRGNFLGARLLRVP